MRREASSKLTHENNIGDVQVGLVGGSKLSMCGMGGVGAAGTFGSRSAFLSQVLEAHSLVRVSELPAPIGTFDLDENLTASDLPVHIIMVDYRLRSCLSSMSSEPAVCRTMWLNAQYARRWGYKFSVMEASDTFECAPSNVSSARYQGWQKILGLAQAMQEAPVGSAVVYLDADAAFLNQSKSLADHFSEVQKFQSAWPVNTTGTNTAYKKLSFAVYGFYDKFALSIGTHAMNTGFIVGFAHEQAQAILQSWFHAVSEGDGLFKFFPAEQAVLNAVVLREFPHAFLQVNGFAVGVNNPDTSFVRHLYGGMDEGRFNQSMYTNLIPPTLVAVFEEAAADGEKWRDNLADVQFVTLKSATELIPKPRGSGHKPLDEFFKRAPFTCIVADDSNACVTAGACITWASGCASLLRSNASRSSQSAEVS